MIYLVEDNIKELMPEIMEDMHRKRCDVFYGDLGWPLSNKDGLEIDQFDLPQSKYVLSLHHKYGVVGGFRLLPTSGPNMVRDVFESHVLHKDMIPKTDKVWEITRLFYNKPREENDRIGFARRGTLELFISMLEFGVENGIDAFLVDVDVRLEKLYINAGWPLNRISEPREFNGKNYVIGILRVCENTLAEVREKTNIKRPILLSHLRGDHQGYECSGDFLAKQLRIQLEKPDQV